MVFIGMMSCWAANDFCRLLEVVLLLSWCSKLYKYLRSFEGSDLQHKVPA